MTNMHDKDKKKVLSLISDGNISEAIQELLKKNSSIGIEAKQQIIAISSRNKQVKKQSRLGILSPEQERLEVNKITNALIELVTDIAVDQPRSSGIYKKNSITWKTIFLSIFFVIVFFFLAELTGYTDFLTAFPKSSLQLTVYVHGEKGKQDIVLQNTGKLVIDFENDRRTALIGENGRTNFGEIPSYFLNQDIGIGLIVDGYELLNPEAEYVLTGRPIYLPIKKDNSLGQISGIIKNRDGSKWIEDAIVSIGNDTSIYTNERGIFKITLPAGMQVEDAKTPYLLTVKKESYKVKTEYYYPKSGYIEIRLSK